MRGRMVMVIVAAAFVLAAPPTGGAYGLTMEEALALALRNNHSIKQFEGLERSARAGVGSSRSAFLPSMQLSYSRTESSEDIFVTEDTSAVLTAQAAYNLFKGFSDLKAVGEAKSLALAASCRKRSVVADVVFAVKSAYIGVLRAGRAVETESESVRLLERQASDAALFYREGLIAKNGLLKVKVELASARQELLEAEGVSRVAAKRLERAVGARLAPDERFVEPGDTTDFSLLSFESLKEEMLGGRSELKYLRAMRDAHRYRVGAARSGYLPVVDLVLSYNRTDIFGGAAPASYDYDVRGTISARWNFFDGFRTSYETARAKHLMRAAEEELSETEEELLFQLREALEGYAVSEGKLRVGGSAVSQAEENYRVTDSQFRERVATSTDLMDARSFLTRARNQYNNALYDLHLSSARIERVLERGRRHGAAE